MESELEARPLAADHTPEPLAPEPVLALVREPKEKQGSAQQQS